ncbi:hypothetical protein Ngar_c35520 [Candidatus Nitrososphaera gargensis Ga9.2]|uniref:Uncharacterized protein n=1 Tax=Nitrososphaera gargensis (strain Ga9.2) TaxID=1237085 RepID=K0IK11_NITGG|nr:PepSY domain-containing protein [Candidatus Nitrososphaera gargensis]AFU60465.1 hypothetical protein Ngar_c35520 [Candidatus Nitrososphaera gargensis Ga9.2]
MGAAIIPVLVGLAAGIAFVLLFNYFVTTQPAGAYYVYEAPQSYEVLPGIKPISLLAKDPEEIATVIANAEDDEIVSEKRGDGGQAMTRLYATRNGGEIAISREMIPECRSGCDYLITYSTNSSIGPDVGFPITEQQALDYAESFLERSGYQLNKHEIFDVDYEPDDRFGKMVQVYQIIDICSHVQPREEGGAICKAEGFAADFHFLSDNTIIQLGMWYDESDVRNYEMRVSLEEAEKIAREHMDLQLRTHSDLRFRSYLYEFDRASADRTMMFISSTGQLLYNVEVRYKTSEIWHCTPYRGFHVMVDAGSGEVTHSRSFTCQ